MAVSIREAVERLDPATRNWLGVRELLPRLVCDPTSRLIAIRDVILYIVMLMLPDPRISCADLRREVEWDVAEFERLRARYQIPGQTKWSLEAVLRDYPDWPLSERYHYYEVKCCRGHVVVFNNPIAIIAIFDSKQQLVIRGRPNYRNSQGVYLIDSKPFTISGRPCPNVTLGSVTLPCGIIICSSYAFNDAGESVRLIPSTLTCGRDDYGELFTTNDTRSERCVFTEWVVLE